MFFSIEKYIFAYCSMLTSVIIPSSVTAIDSIAFIGCQVLTSIYAYSTTPISLSYGLNIFSGRVDTAKCTLHVPKGTLAAYKAANVWKGFGTITDDLTSAVFNAKASSVKISVQNGLAVVTGAQAGALLSVYNLQGTSIYKGKTSGETESISLPESGVYIVVVDGNSVKLLY